MCSKVAWFPQQSEAEPLTAFRTRHAQIIFAKLNVGAQVAFSNRGTISDIPIQYSTLIHSAHRRLRQLFAIAHSARSARHPCQLLMARYTAIFIRHLTIRTCISLRTMQYSLLALRTPPPTPWFAPPPPHDSGPLPSVAQSGVYKPYERMNLG
jgi:hypothetical protein